MSFFLQHVGLEEAAGHLDGDVSHLQVDKAGGHLGSICLGDKDHLGEKNGREEERATD